MMLDTAGSSEAVIAVEAALIAGLRLSGMACQYCQAPPLGMRVPGGYGKTPLEALGKGPASPAVAGMDR